MGDKDPSKREMGLFAEVTSTVITSVANSTGSEQLLTDATYNPWDKRGPDGRSPSERIAGNQQPETAVEGAKTSGD